MLYRDAREETRRAQDIQAFLESTLIPPGVWSRASEYDVLDVLRSAEARIATELDGQPESEASLRLRLANIYRGLWKWNEVALHSRRSLDLFTTLEGETSDNALRARFQLGVAMSFLGDPECVSFQERTLELFEGAVPAELDGSPVRPRGTRLRDVER